MSTFLSNFQFEHCFEYFFEDFSEDFFPTFSDSKPYSLSLVVDFRADPVGSGHSLKDKLSLWIFLGTGAGEVAILCRYWSGVSFLHSFA